MAKNDVEVLEESAATLRAAKAVLGSIQESGATMSMPGILRDIKGNLQAVADDLVAVRLRLQAKDAAVKDAQRRLAEYQLQHQAGGRTAG